jgi:hypothetical protein
VQVVPVAGAVAAVLSNTLVLQVTQLFSLGPSHVSHSEWQSKQTSPSDAVVVLYVPSLHEFTHCPFCSTLPAPHLTQLSPGPVQSAQFESGQLLHVVSLVPEHHDSM